MDDLHNYKDSLSAKIENAKVIQRLSQLTLQCSGVVYNSLQGDEKQEFNQLMNSVKRQEVAATTTLNENLNKQQEWKQLKATQEDQLIIPSDIDDDAIPEATINVKELQAAVGELNDKNKHSVKQFCNKLRIYGEKNQYSHEDYKQCLSMLLEGSLLTEFMQLQDQAFPEIITWFYEVYHQPETLANLKVQLAQFQRNPTESISICMKRYELPAKRADKHLPRNEKFYTQARNLTEVLLSFVHEPAKTNLVKWRNYHIENGRPILYPDILAKASDLEKFHGCTTLREMNNLEICKPSTSQIQQEVENDFDDEIEEEEIHAAMRNPRMIRSDLRANVKKMLKHQVDPIKATGNRPPFYNSRKPTQNQTPQQQRNGNDSRFAAGNKPSWMTQRHHPYQRNNTSRTKNQFYGKRAIENKPPPAQQQRQPQQFRFVNQNRPNNYDNYRQNRQNGPTPQYRPYVQNRQQNQNQSGNYNRNGNKNAPRKFDARHNVVKQNLFCARCGKSNKAKSDHFANSDHSTYDCPVYKHHNPHGCPICLGFDIDAKHFMTECKQKRE